MEDATQIIRKACVDKNPSIVTEGTIVRDITLLDILFTFGTNSPVIGITTSGTFLFDGDWYDTEQVHTELMKDAKWDMKNVNLAGQSEQVHKLLSYFMQINENQE